MSEEHTTLREHREQDAKKGRVNAAIFFRALVDEDIRIPHISSGLSFQWVSRVQLNNPDEFRVTFDRHMVEYERRYDYQGGFTTCTLDSYSTPCNVCADGCDAIEQIIKLLKEYGYGR